MSTLTHAINTFYAHSLKGLPVEKWQPLEEHLENVAVRASASARFFRSDAWVFVAGKNHDIGKGTLSWQAWLRRENRVEDEYDDFYQGHPNHAAIGAQLLFKQSTQAGKLLAYCIAGHHGGLPNWSSGQRSGLGEKLSEQMVKIDFPHVPEEFPTDLPFPLENDYAGFQIQFFVRMLFSCLVDGDYLDTETFLDKKRAGWRNCYPCLVELHNRFWTSFNTLRKKADPDLSVNKCRESVLSDCLQSANESPGIFSLTVPTGGGKTLASLAFALNHAKKYKKRRIIYVIPFTSIIEQNGKVFQDMLGDDAVLEHHCNFIADDADWQTRLATENWDAPIIVTTNVQFFDSFFANKPSKCRKLHNVSESVVIFDEVQAIPVERLTCCLGVIQELAKNYGVTSVLCTATQPAIEHSSQFPAGLKIDREIVTDIPALFAALKRTEERFIGTLTEHEVAKQLAKLQQVLCIVNTRQQALDVFENLPESRNNFHLSALMYPAHRSEIFSEIRTRLENGDPCRVVSTQLIEAGVDVDFPAVFRATAGIDSIAQAAGRCNRNGRSPVPCKVSVFDFPEESGCGFFRQAAQSAKKLFESFVGKLTDPECVKEYFSDFFWKNEQMMDKDGIYNLCCLAYMGEIQFRDIAGFRMIESATLPVIIALDPEALQLVDRLAHVERHGGILRKLQKYAVQIYPYQLDEIRDWLEEPVPGIWVLRSQELYSRTTGLQCSAPMGEAFFG
ncbi:CRISPR-associated helicase Cas3' [Desulfomarina sp.]